jgi:hypothetical protein
LRILVIILWRSKMKTIYIKFSMLILTALFLAGCYTQVAVKETGRSYAGDYDDRYYGDEEYYDEYSDTAYYESDSRVEINNYYIGSGPMYSRYYWGGYYPSFYVGIGWGSSYFYDPWCINPWWYGCMVTPYPIYNPWFYSYGGYYGYPYYGYPYYGGWYGSGTTRYRERDRDLISLRNNSGLRNSSVSRSTLSRSNDRDSDRRTSRDGTSLRDNDRRTSREGTSLRDNDRRTTGRDNTGVSRERSANERTRKEAGVSRPNRSSEDGSRVRSTERDTRRDDTRVTPQRDTRRDDTRVIPQRRNDNNGSTRKEVTAPPQRSREEVKRDTRSTPRVEKQNSGRRETPRSSSSPSYNPPPKQSSPQSSSPSRGSSSGGSSGSSRGSSDSGSKRTR